MTTPLPATTVAGSATLPRARPLLALAAVFGAVLVATAQVPEPVSVAAAGVTQAVTEAPVESLPGATWSRGRCATCGYVRSVRQVAASDGAPAHHELTVRLDDGTTRISRGIDAASWQPGDRILLIGGLAPAGG